MVVGGSLRWPFLLLLLLILVGQLSEGKRGGGGSRSGSRGSSSARSSSKSSSSKSSGRFFSEGSKSSSDSRSTGKTSWSSSKSSSRSGGGFQSSSGSTYFWSSAQPRPSLTRDSVSRGIFSSSRTSIYYGSSSGCGFGGCGNTYTVYHYYPRSHYYSGGGTTTHSPIGPKVDQVSGTLNGNDTLIYSSVESGNETEVMEIADPTKPLVIQDLAFFWDTKYLPSEDTEGCATYTPANGNSNISFCDVTEYSRCERKLTELPGFIPDNLYFSDGTNPSHLAWLCPKDTSCCDWECCHDEAGWDFFTVLFMVIVSSVLLYYVVRCCRGCKGTYEKEKEKRRAKEESHKLRDNS